ncbi:MAG TPA: winged helix-turn-helix transcriptional regulator [Longimicrobiales bacterium]
MMNLHVARAGEAPLHAPGLGESQQLLLRVLKRAGRATVADIAQAIELNRETVREHMRVLVAMGLVVRVDAASGRVGRGRPEQVYALTDAAERLFPRREGEMLRELAAYLAGTGNEALLHGFLERWIGARREEAMRRVAPLEGRARLEEVARILSEDGFMAEVEAGEGDAHLRLTHCPMRGLVDATRLPCRMEISFVTELVGAPLTRLGHMPAGDACCSYRAERAAAPSV